MNKSQSLWMVYVQPPQSSISLFLVEAENFNEAVSAADQVISDNEKYHGSSITKLEAYYVPLMKSAEASADELYPD